MTTHTTAVDHPSPEIATVGRELDRLLAGLITLLGGAMPPQLGNEVTA
jgi:hypothetical protein